MAVAKVLKWWIERVAQTTTAFVSDDDISLGTRWSDRIKNELAETRVGIICVTPDNQTAPWINFEAGAISKAVDGNDNKVIPILIDYRKKTDYKGPLSEFNLALLDREGLLKLAKAINDTLVEPKSAPEVEETFEAWWPQLEKKIADVHEAEPASQQPSRHPDDVNSEILEIVRDLQKRSLTPVSTGPFFGRTVEASVRGYRLPGPVQPDPSNVIREIFNYGQSIDNSITAGMSSDQQLTLVTNRPLAEEERQAISLMALGLPAGLQNVRFVTRDSEPTGEIPAH